MKCLDSREIKSVAFNQVVFKASRLVLIKIDLLSKCHLNITCGEQLCSFKLHLFLFCFYCLFTTIYRLILCWFLLHQHILAWIIFASVILGGVICSINFMSPLSPTTAECKFCPFYATLWIYSQVYNPCMWYGNQAGR